MHICNVRSQVFFPRVWVCLRDFILFFIFLAALSANLHCGKTLGLEKSFQHGKVFQEYGWETRTFEEGKKKAPLIQGGGLRQAHTIEKVENPSFRLLNNIFTYCPSLWVRTTCHMTAEFVLMLFVCFQGWVIMGKLRVPYGINTLTSWEKTGYYAIIMGSPRDN